MGDETPNGPAGTSDGGRHPGGSEGNGSPFQARAAFIKNWDWQSVVRINRGTCERGRAQHGLGPETGKACEEEWEAKRFESLTLAETLDFLKRCHLLAPFQFFNGRTFAAI